MGGLFLYRLGSWCLQRLSLKHGYRLAEVAADIAYLILRKNRWAVHDNLRHILNGSCSNSCVGRVGRRLFRNYAKYLVDFFRLPKFQHEDILRRFRIEGLSKIRRYRAQGKGILFITAHFGNWELGGAVFSMLGFPLAVVALPHKERGVTRFFTERRQEKGVRVIPFPEAARGGLEVLRQRGCLALLGDKNFAQQSLPANFFGKLAYFPRGPVNLALKTGAVVVPGFVIRQGEYGYRMVFEDPVSLESSGDLDRDLRENTSRFLKVIERYIATYPDQWFVFQPFWRS